jgi:hypothetical protein
MKLIVVLSLALSTAGCISMPFDAGSTREAQFKRDAAACQQIGVPWGPFGVRQTVTECMENLGYPRKQ